MNPQAIEITVRKYRDAINTQMLAAIENPDFWGHASNQIFVRTHILAGVDIGPNDYAASFVHFLIDLDPSPKSIYVKWMIRCWLTMDMGYFLLEDLGKLTDDLIVFDVAKKTLLVEHRNIDFFKSYRDFSEFVATMEVRDSKRGEDKALAARLIAEGSVTIMHDDDDLRIVIPRTVLAAQYHGRNTKWCTASRNSYNAFQSYNDEGPLYIILFKKENRRWQFHFKSGQMMDEEDRQIAREVILDSIAYSHFDWREAFYINQTLLPYYKGDLTEGDRVSVLRKWSLAYKYLGELTDSEAKLAVRSFPNLVTNPDFKQTPELREIALSCDPRLVTKLPNVTQDEISAAIKKDSKIFLDLPRELITNDLCLLAIQCCERQPLDRLRGPGAGKSWALDFEITQFRQYPKREREAIYGVPPELLTPSMIELYERLTRMEVDVEHFVHLKTETDIRNVQGMLIEYEYMKLNQGLRYTPGDRNGMKHKRRLDKLEKSFDVAMARILPVRYEPLNWTIDFGDNPIRARGERIRFA